MPPYIPIMVIIVISNDGYFSKEDFLSETVSLTADGKEMEIKAALLYGAGLKEIWLKLLMPSAEMLVPVEGIILIEKLGAVPAGDINLSIVLYN